MRLEKQTAKYALHIDVTILDYNFTTWLQKHASQLATGSELFFWKILAQNCYCTKKELHSHWKYLQPKNTEFGHEIPTTFDKTLVCPGLFLSFNIL